MPPSELNAEVLAEDASPSESRAEPADGSDDASFDIVADDGTVISKNNRLTVDDASRQTLTMAEIEELKRAGAGSGKEIIERIMASHTNLDEKTAFSLAKYTLRKSRKYLKRFTVLPLDVSTLAEWMLTEKEASRIMELREESIGLINSWANVHYGGADEPHATEDAVGKVGGGRWLVVDETSGLVVAALAERMGILYPHSGGEEEEEEEEPRDAPHGDEQENTSATTAPATETSEPAAVGVQPGSPELYRKKSNKNTVELASNNTLHLLHSNAQPNISLLKYFGYDTNNPSPSHPLHSHLKPLSWLQLLDPSSDATYAEPEAISPSVLDTWKSGKRGTYYRKRRRWERCKSIVDETRDGGFDGLVVASAMEPATILQHLVPLLRGSGHVVVYSPTVEPLVELIDVYSKDRKAAYISHLQRGEQPPEEDFPVDPRLLLGSSVQTARTRQWQVLPGRTHPLMTSKGGAEGFLFTARKVLPVEGRVEARGKFAKKRKVG